jgi:hypothetical protein
MNPSNFFAELKRRNIHSDPRWLPFLRKIGKAPSNSRRSSSN